ncbi:MAG: AAA family ATPase, partial [Oscillibacter sp.]|nr:AAA family ATPase [Oscillibacter sp.]
MDIRNLSLAIQEQTEKIIVGKPDKIRLIVMAVLANGHVLLDDLPGVGKTTLVKTISLALGCRSGRIQFVPDMLPSDIIGMRIYNQKLGDFELRQGPVMTNLLLADEINRAIPRTQSALLEAMEERQISIDGEQFALPRPFLVLATQNPVESESTFRLPAAQMDRFLIRISMGYPNPEEERQMLRQLGDEIPLHAVRPVTSPEELLQA